MRKYLLYLFVLSTFVGCKKDKPGSEPAETTSRMELQLDGESMTLDEKNIQALYYADGGESSGALEINGQLPGNKRIVFFLRETKASTITLDQKFPAVMTASSHGGGLAPLPAGNSNELQDGINKLAKAKIAETLSGSLTVPVYVKYVTPANQFFAVSGTITVKIDGNDLTFDWNISFKDADGKIFSSKGSATIRNYKSNLRPKSQISNPGSELAISGITPEYGKAGTEITIKGTGFSVLKEENNVKLGDLGLEITSASATELKVLIPENGTHDHLSVSVLGS